MKRKKCGDCKKRRSINAFGICRARKDGRNLYCRDCINTRMYDLRKKLKEHKANQIRIMVNQLEARPETRPELSLVKHLKLSPVDKVRLAIQRGAGTQLEIGRATKLGKDEVCDALAILLLWNHEIRSQIVDGRRIYLPVTETERKPCKPSRPLTEILISLGPRAKVKAA